MSTSQTSPEVELMETLKAAKRAAEKAIDASQTSPEVELMETMAAKLSVTVFT